MEAVDSKHLPKEKLPAENRQTLLMKQSELKNELDLQFADIKEDATDAGKKALLIGGTLYATYKLVKWATSDSKNHHHHDDDQPVLEEKRRIYKRGAGAPLVYKKEQKVGLTFGQLLKQQLMTVGALIIAGKVKGLLREKKILQE